MPDTDSNSDAAGNLITEDLIAGLAATRGPLVEPEPPSDYQRGIDKDAATMPLDVAKVLTRHGFKVEIEGQIPEEVSLSFATTPLKGGDAGHGGVATLHIRVEGGSHALRLAGTGDDEVVFDSERYPFITFEARGDWEMSGLLDGLVELGERLRPLAAARRRYRFIRMSD